FPAGSEPVHGTWRLHAAHAAGPTVRSAPGSLSGPGHVAIPQRVPVSRCVSRCLNAFMEISGETVYLFRHGMLRDAAYQLQTPSFRATLHAWALELLEVLIPESERAPYAHELAEHALAAQEERADEAMQHKELAYLKLAANHARDSFQNNMAVEMFRRVAKHPQCAPGDRVEASVASARVLAMVGDVRGADAELAEVERDELSGELAALVGLARAELDSISGHLDTSIEALERAIMSAQAPRLRFDILRAKAAYLERLG